MKQPGKMLDVENGVLIENVLISIENAGSVEPGKWADIIAVRGNPLEDVTLLENVQFVMKGGKVYKSHM